jgi:hypothetical protein
MTMARDVAQRCGFPGTVGSEQAQTDPSRHLQVQIVDGCTVAELFGNRVELDDGAG